MGANSAKIDYVASVDILCIRNNTPMAGEGVAVNVTAEHDFDVFYSEDGKCVKIYLFDAARILLPPLTQDAPETAFQYKDVVGFYCQGEDKLIIGNGIPATNSDEMADGIMAHYNDEGLAVSFTLENVSQWLLPHLRTWRGAESESERS